MVAIGGKSQKDSVLLLYFDFKPEAAQAETVEVPIHTIKVEVSCAAGVIM
jgi:hypothetical protein